MAGAGAVAPRLRWGLEKQAVAAAAWEQRICPHCQGGIDITLFLNAPCTMPPDLFNRPTTLHAFFEQPIQRLTLFAAAAGWMPPPQLLALLYSHPLPLCICDAAYFHHCFPLSTGLPPGVSASQISRFGHADYKPEYGYMPHASNCHCERLAQQCPPRSLGEELGSVESYRNPVPGRGGEPEGRKQTCSCASASWRHRSAGRSCSPSYAPVL